VLDRDEMYAKSQKAWQLMQQADHNGNLPPARETDPPVADATPGPGSADQGAKDGSVPGMAPPGSYQHELAAAEARGDTATAMRLKSERIRELSDTAGI
jgi:hypothetical protein